MNVDNALAGVAVRDLEDARHWYSKLIGDSGRKPMTGVVEWTLPRGGVLQVFTDAKRAGSSSVTFAVSDIDQSIRQLKQQGVEVGDRSTSASVSTAVLTDPSGNQVVLAQAHDSSVAR